MNNSVILILNNLVQHVNELIVGKEECKEDPEDKGVYNFSLKNTVLQNVRVAWF